MDSNTYSTESAPGRTVLLEDAEYLFFGGTAYLGMQENKAFRKLLEEGLDRYGPVHGSSRTSNLQLGVYQRAEREMARWLGSEACTVLSSGFMAGQLLAGALSGAGWKLHYAPGCHPALLTGEAAQTGKNRDEAPGTAWAKWAGELLAELNTAVGKHAVLACSVDPLRSRRYDLSFAGYLPPSFAGRLPEPFPDGLSRTAVHALAEGPAGDPPSHPADLAGAREILLVVDDSHGLGVLGAAGEGIAGELRQYDNVELLILGSLGKGMGIPAGAVWSTAERARWLRRSSVFISASPPAPAGLYAFTKAADLYREAMEQLKGNIAHFSTLIKNFTQIKQAPGLPVFSLEDEAAAAYLMQRRILISSFPYPEADSKPLSRIVLSALHKPADLETLAAALKDYFAD